MADGVVIFDVELNSDGISSALSGVGSKIARSAAVAAAGAAIGKSLSAAIRTGMEFEGIMSKVEALSGATSAQMAELTEAAKQWGADTAFSASEVGQAFTYMAQAGWDTSQMLAGIGPVLNLAAADGLDLATTSDIVTDSLTAFGLKAADTAMYADVLATAAAASNTNVAMMGETFKYAAPVAGALGYSVQDVALAVGLMANAGIKGSQAGTSLRGILTRMVKPTKQSAEALDDLGLSLSKADGTMKPFGQVLGELRTAFAGLTAEEKANYAALLAGQEGMSGLLAIVNASDTDFNDLADAINNSSGAAERMAETMLDNLAGDIEQFKGAAETLALEFYGTFSDKLRTAVQTGTGIIDKLTEGVKEGDLAGALSSIFTTDMPLIAEGLGEMIGQAFAKLPEMLQDTGDVTGSLLTGILDSTKALAKGIVDGIGTALPDLIPNIATSLVSGLSTAFESLPEYTQAATNLLYGLKKSLVGTDGEAVSTAVSDLATSIGASLSTALENLPELLTSGATILTELGKGASSGIATFVSDLVTGLGDEFPNQMEGLGKSFVTALSTAISSLPDLATSVGEIIGSLAKALGEGIAGLLEGTGEGMESTLVQNLANIAKAIVSGLAAAIPGVTDGLSALGDAILTGLKNSFVGEDGTTGIVGELAQSLIDGMNDFFTTTMPSLNIKLPSWADIVAASGEALDGLITDAQEALKLLMTIELPTWEDIKSGFQTLVDEIKTFFTDSFSNFWANIFGGGEGGEGEGTSFWDRLIESLFPKANAAELPDNLVDQNNTVASQAEQDFHRALVEAFQNGEISYAELVAAAFGGTEGVSIEEQMAEIYAQMETIGASLKQHLLAGLSGAGAGAEGAAAGAAGEAGEGGEDAGMLALGLSLAQSVAKGITSGAGDVKSSLEKTINDAKKSIETTYLPEFKTLGEQISQGIADGITAGSGAIADALVSAVLEALGAAKSALGIASPSKVARDVIGRWIPPGAAEGVKMESWQLRNAVRQMALDSMHGMSALSRRAASGIHFGFADARIAKRAAMLGYGQPIQEVNFNVPVQTPDEFAETVELFMTYGLEADY